MRKTIGKSIKILTVMLMTFTSTFSSIPSAKALAKISGDDILNQAHVYSSWGYWDVGTCTGLVTRTLDDLGIGDSIVGSMVGTSAKYSPDQMYANANANPNDAKLVWRGTVSDIASATSLIKNGDLVIQRSSDVYPNTGFGHVAFIDMDGTGIYMYGANNAETNVGRATLLSYNKGLPVGQVDGRNRLSIYRLVEDIQYGNLNLTKQDEDGNYIPNTSFSLSYNSNMSDPIGTYTTGSNGQVTIEGLLTQKVYIQEKSVPEPLILDTEIREITVLANDTVSYSATNRYKTGTLEIQKLDVDTGKPVKTENAEFNIYTSDGVFVNTIKTNSNGVATLTGIRWGDYYFLEQKAPDKYTSSNERVDFSIRDNGVTIAKSLSNKRTLGTIELKKIDKETGETAQGDASLDGAVYNVYAKEDILNPSDHSVIYKAGTLVNTMTIVNGNAKLENLFLGKYQIKEDANKTGLGYLVDKTVYDVNLNYTDQSKTVEIKSVTSNEQVKKRAFQIIKISSDGESGTTPTIKGAHFVVKLESEVQKVGWEHAKSYDELVTDENGFAKSIELPYGNYRVRETVVPANHNKVPDFFVQVKDDSREPMKWTVQNDVPFKTYIGIVKVDAETGDIVRLSGATFKIKNLDTDEYVGFWVYGDLLGKYVTEFTTNDEGNIMTPGTVRAGHYQIEEIKAPNGMLLSRKSKPFTISADGAHQIGPDGTSYITTIQFENKPAKGQLILEKTADLFMGFETSETEYGTLYTPKFEEGLLSGVTYEIRAREDIKSADGTRTYYKKGQVIETLKTDGLTSTKSSILPLGAYTIKEIACENNAYVIDPNVYEFDLIYKNQLTEVVFQTMKPFNERQKASATIKKSIEDSISDNNNAYKNIKFGVYTANDLSVNGTKQLEKDSLLQVVSLNETLKGKINIDFASDYYIKELATDNQYQLSDAKIPFNYTYAGDKETIIEINGGEPIYNYVKRGRLEIFKSDALTEKPLINVWYQLSTDEKFENIIKETCTDEKGKAIFEEVEKGTYYVRERYDNNNDMVLEGYVKDPTVHKVKIQENGEVVVLTLNNQPVRGKVTFNKHGETFNKVDIVEGAYGQEFHPVWEETSLLGSELTVYASEDIKTWDGTLWYKKGAPVITLESDWDTTESITLPVGKYYAKETKIPHGYYEIEPEKYEFEIIKNGSEEIQIYPISILNKRAKVNINFTKLMEDKIIYKNDNSYKDVAYGLFAREDIYDYMGKVAIKNDSLIGISGINEEGHLEKTYDLPNGAYYYKELATNNHFVLDTEEYDFVVEYKGSSVDEYTIDINHGDTIYNYVKRGRLEISKSDALTEKPLVNVWYQLSTDDKFNNIIKETCTNEKGNAIFEEIEAGTYYVRERYDAKNDMVVEGYVKDPTVQKIEIQDNEQVIKMSLKNQPVLGKVTFDKRGETFNRVDVVDGMYGKETHPIWEETPLLGSELTIYASEDIKTWDGTLWYKKGSVVTTLESDWNTKESTTLPVGKYYAKETKIPHGYYDKEHKVYEFEIEKNGDETIQVYPVTILNKRAKVNIDFTKIMEEQKTFVNKNAYEDVVFGLYAREDIYDYMGKVAIKNGTLIGTSGITKEGKLKKTYDLPNGLYYYKEIATNGQYILNSKEEYDFEIGYQGSNVDEYTININNGNAIKNELIHGMIEINKVTKDNVYYSDIEKVLNNLNSLFDQNLLRDKDTEYNYLAGVEFELSTDKEFKNIIRTGKTDVTGRLIFDELEKGKYYAREKNSLFAYELNDTVFEFEIEKNGQVEMTNVENSLKESYVTIKKVDANNHDKVLSGAEFALYSDANCTKEIERITTDDNGLATFKKLKFGTKVYIKEVKAPTGYQILNEVIEVTIDYNWLNMNDKNIIVSNHIVESVNTGMESNDGLVVMFVGSILLMLFTLRNRKKEQ